MTEAQAVEAILQQWETAWEALHPVDPEDPDHVPYTFDNEAFDAVAAWARVTVVHTSRIQATSGPVGSRKFECRGHVFVQLFGAIDAGRKPLAELADDTRTAMESRTMTSLESSDVITAYAGVTREGPTEGRWCMSVVTVPFRYTQTR